MPITPEQLKKIAHLAKLTLTSDDEAEKYANEISSIMQYVDILQEVDISNTIPTAQVTGLENVTHSESIVSEKNTFTTDIADKTLLTSSLPQEAHQIKVPNIL